MWVGVSFLFGIVSKKGSTQIMKSVVFIKQISFETYEAQVDGKQIVVKLRNYSPIKHSVIYSAHDGIKDELIILDGKKKEWSKELHTLYIKSPHEFIQPFDIDKYKNCIPLHDDFRKWVGFDEEFHLQKLVPNVPVSQFSALYKNGDFKDILYKIGGVAPHVLAKLLNQKRDPLVLQAIVLEYITNTIKSDKTMWVPESKLGFLLVQSHLNDACSTLRKNNVIAADDSHGITLQWILNKATAITNKEFVEKPGIHPVDANAAIGPMIEVDPRLPIDRFIDFMVLPSTLMVKTRFLPISPRHTVTLNSIEQVKDYINHTLQNEERYVVVTDTITIAHHHTRYTCINVIPIGQFKKNQVISVLFDGDCYLVEKGPQKLETDIIHSHFRCISEIQFQKLIDLPVNASYGHIFAVFSRGTSPHWFYRLECYKKCKVVTILIN